MHLTANVCVYECRTHVSGYRYAVISVVEEYREEEEIEKYFQIEKPAPLVKERRKRRTQAQVVREHWICLFSGHSFSNGYRVLKSGVQSYPERLRTVKLLSFIPQSVFQCSLII